MSDIEYFDYLVLGGEHHGEIHNGLKTPKLELHSKKQPLPRFYGKDEPAEVTIHNVVTYQVVEHTREDKKHFFIASNEDLSQFDIDAEILKYGPAPVN